MYKIGIIGVGNMGEAILKALISKANIKSDSVIIFDIDRQKLNALEKSLKVKTASSIKDITKAKYIFLVVKPKDYKDVLSSLKESISENNIIISVLAGIKIESIKNIIGEIPVVRIMPNTPMLVGEGAIGVAFDNLIKEDDKIYLSKLFSSIGETVFVKEEFLDAITGLSGSGPAYVFTFIEAMVLGGVKMGLSYEDSLKLTVQTVLGSAKMLKEIKEHPAILRDKVSSPAGTTIYALHELEKRGFKDAVISAVEQATKRSRELSKNQ